MRFVLKSVALLGVGLVLFWILQVLFGFAHPHCFDCGAKYGFPFHYAEDGTYATHGHTIWTGFVADYVIAVGICTFTVWMYKRLRTSR
jgi:hypothetical protein